MKYLKYTREILIIGLVLFVILLFVKPCGKAKDLAAYRLLQEKAKSLEEKVKADSIARNEERKAFQAEKQETEGKRQLAEVERTESDNKVRQQQRTIDRLVARITNQPEKPDSSAMVLVTPDFKEACEELPVEIAKLNLALADKDSSINGILDLYNYEIKIRDEELYKEMNYSDSLKVDFVRQTKLLKSALQQGKPRGQFLVGVGIMGNEDQFLGGASGKAAYLTKGGKMYQYSSHVLKLLGMENAKLYHELSVFFNPFK